MNRGTQKASDNGDPSGGRQSAGTGLGAPGRPPFLERSDTGAYHSDNPEPTTPPPAMPGKSVGVTRLPMPETLAQVVGNRQLPQGNLLRCLAERLKLPLGTLLTCEIAASPELVPAVIQMAGTTLVANLWLLTLLAGTDCKGVCQSTGLNLHQVEAYVAGRRLPPEGNLLRLATAFGLTREALLGALPQPDPAAVGQRIHTRLEAMGLKRSTAAGKMTLGVSKFLAVAAGTTLPDGHQLKKICDFLGLSKWELLGLQPVAFPASLGSWGIPAAAVLDTASNRAGYAELPMAA